MKITFCIYETYNRKDTSFAWISHVTLSLIVKCI